MEKLHEHGFPVPQRLADAADHVRLIGSTSTPPESPLPGDPDFARKLDKYVTAHAKWLAEREAYAAMLDDAKRVLTQISVESFDEVLGHVRPAFTDAAREWTESHRELDGVTSLSEAASADIDGTAVRAWHRRTAAAKRLTSLVDVLKRMLDPLVPGGWRSEQTACLITEVPAGFGGVLASDIRGSSAPDGQRRYVALADHGFPLSLVDSLDDYLARLDTMSGE
ncbi:hypothetical protein [Pseudonocardia phyllosphaerae]|uniref:hypothetical protein n=1 Tax=Pseudonocardia phyllosphaerae TaxID=3390502 RepID=UPI003979377C